MRILSYVGLLLPEFSKKHSRFLKWRWSTLVWLSACCGLATFAQANTGLAHPYEPIFTDSSAQVQFRNYYFSRDFRKVPPTAASQSAEWAQGILATFRSGYSNTPLQLGFDLIAISGIKLDSQADKRNSGLLANQSDGQPADAYGRVGATLKLKIADTELKLGELMPNLPILTHSDIRLLPPSYQGVTLSSQIKPALALQAGYLTTTSLRNRAGRDKLQPILGHIPQRQVSSDSFRYVGADYQSLTAGLWRLWHGNLEDVYAQTYLNYQQQFNLTEALHFRANIGYFYSTEHGRALLNKLDNQALYGLFSLRRGAHTGFIGYQQMRGTSAFPRVFANVSILGNEVPTFEFASAGERSWQVRYDTDFSVWGIPGLTTTLRYIRSEDARVGANTDAKAFERDLDLAYQIQEGVLEGLGVRLRNVTARANYRPDIDENRVILTYTVILK